MFCFLFFHEIAHRFNGHQLISRKSMDDRESKLIKRMIEWDADSFSATQLSSIFFEMSIQQNKLDIFFQSVSILIHIFIIFLWLMNKKKKKLLRIL